MKKIMLAILTIFLIITLCNNKSYAAYLESGNYLEKNQWGALEDILSDWKVGKISTDECAIYGCYVLVAQEPSRIDRKEKIKLIPNKYNLNKKSAESGPYFFVTFLYNYENKFNKKTKEELINSDWYDHYVLKMVPESIVTDEIAKNIANKTNDEYILFDKYYDALLEKKLVNPEFKALIYVMRLSAQKERISKIFYEINGFKKYKVKLGGLIIGKVSAYFFSYKNYPIVKNTIKTIKSRNLINYHIYMHQLFISGKRI